MRDIEHTFIDRAGRCVLTKSAARELTERLWADYQAFAGRDLTEHTVVYLFVDGIAERLHLGQPREAVLAAWGITLQGYQVLLGLAQGTKEDTVSCREFLRDLKSRGMPEPLLVGTDGAPGLIRAVEEVFPRSLRQRCLAHKSAISKRRCRRRCGARSKRGRSAPTRLQAPNLLTRSFPPLKMTRSVDLQ